MQTDFTGRGFDHAADGAHGGGLAGAVGADQGNHLALGHVDGDAMQDADLAITGFEVLNTQHCAVLGVQAAWPPR
jgi:hypothetical protein